MVPKIIKGHSFKGCAGYLLRGSDGQQTDRVDFTATRNLLTENPETAHRHLHLLINRVNPITGGMLSSSNDRLRLSKWAQQWEQEHGVYCEQRIINNAAREGDYIRDPGVPIHLAKASGRPVNDNERDAQAAKLRDEERAANEVVAREQAEVKARQQKKWDELQKAYRVRRGRLKADIAKRVAAAKKPIKASWRQRRAELYHETKAEIAAYRQREKTWLGRLTNSVEPVDLLAMIRGDKKVKAITGVFTRLVSPAARFQRKLHELSKQEDAIRGKQKAQERAAARSVLDHPDTKAAWGELGVWFQVQRAELSLACSAEDAVYRARWRKRAQDRDQVWAPVREQEQKQRASRERSSKRKPRQERKSRRPS